MSAQITVTVTPISLLTSAVDCTDCGPMGLYPEDDVSKAVHSHLMVTHLCDPNTVKINNKELP